MPNHTHSKYLLLVTAPSSQEAMHSYIWKIHIPRFTQLTSSSWDASNGPGTSSMTLIGSSSQEKKSPSSLQTRSDTRTEKQSSSFPCAPFFPVILILWDHHEYLMRSLIYLKCQGVTVAHLAWSVLHNKHYTDFFFLLLFLFLFFFFLKKLGWHAHNNS